MGKERNDKGQFIKGSGGRNKGDKNKRTERIDELLDYLTDSGAERFMEALNSLSDEDFIKVYKDLIEYVKPKLARKSVEVEHSGKVDNGGIIVKTASKEDIAEVKKLINGN